LGVPYTGGLAALLKTKPTPKKEEKRAKENAERE